MWNCYEWVGLTEIMPTNYVLDEKRADIGVNIFDPRSFTIPGDEWNQNADEVDRPIIMVISRSDQFEWLRM